MSLRTEQIAAQREAFEYALNNPELAWGRHLMGPRELEWLLQQAKCAERVNDANKWRRVAKRLAYALSFEAGAREDAQKIRASALVAFHKLEAKESPCPE